MIFYSSIFSFLQPLSFCCRCRPIIPPTVVSRPSRNVVLMARLLNFKKVSRSTQNAPLSFRPLCDWGGWIPKPALDYAHGCNKIITNVVLITVTILVIKQRQLWNENILHSQTTFIKSTIRYDYFAALWYTLKIVFFPNF